ncbi:class I SAM-dependent methyltransferase [Nonomuraea ferruginea]
MLRGLLGEGAGPCLEIGCGTGVHARVVRELGWAPFGVDLSERMLRHARGRLPTLRADAARLPFADGRLPAVIAVMVHTDMPRYPPGAARGGQGAASRRAVRARGGVHPCFCGGFADRSDPGALVIRPGYRDSHWTKESWTDKGVRAKVGASHWPLSGLLNDFLAAGLTPERFEESGGPVPLVLAVRARKAQP